MIAEEKGEPIVFTLLYCLLKNKMYSCYTKIFIIKKNQT